MNEPVETDRIVLDPEVAFGKPIVRGTRVPVFIIAGLYEVGQSVEEIVDDYPDLSIADVLAAIEYARLSPDTLERPIR